MTEWFEQVVQRFGDYDGTALDGASPCAILVGIKGDG